MGKLSLVYFTIAVCAFGSCFASPLMNHIEADGVEKYLNCVDNMQASSENMKAPFEVLIQGPNSNRFVRSLMGAEALSTGSTDSRLTSSVHQPEAERSTGDGPPKEIDTEKESQLSCETEDHVKRDDTQPTPETVNTEQNPSPSRSKRQTSEAPDGAIAEGVSTPENSSATSQAEPKVGSPLGLLGLHVGIPAALGLGHLGLLHRGLRVHHAVGLHHALTPLRHVLHHAPLVPLLGAANPNADGQPVGQENQLAQTSDPSPQPTGQELSGGMMTNAQTILHDRINHHIQRFRQMIPTNQGQPPASAPMPQ